MKFLFRRDADVAAHRKRVAAAPGAAAADTS